jgi:hypothetical protein
VFGNLGFPQNSFFVWVLFNNKLLTRDNLEKRRKVEDLICLFCKEKETISHLFFDCVAARQACMLLSEVVDFDMGLDYETMSKCWLCNTKFGVANVLSSAVCLGIWKLRNSLCFQNIPWKSMKQLWSVVIPMLRCWRIIMPLKISVGFDAVIDLLEKLNSRPMLLEQAQAGAPALDTAVST